MVWYDWHPDGALFSLFVITLLCEVYDMCQKADHLKNSFNGKISLTDAAILWNNFIMFKPMSVDLHIAA